MESEGVPWLGYTITPNHGTGDGQNDVIYMWIIDCVMDIIIVVVPRVMEFEAGGCWLLAAGCHTCGGRIRCPLWANSTGVGDKNR